MFNYDIPIQAKLIIAIVGILLLAGVWIMMTGMLPYPSKKARKVVKVFNEKNKKRKSTSNAIDDFCKNYSKKFVKFISITNIEKSEMGKALQLSGDSSTPEEYKAYCYTVGGLFVLIGIPFLLVGFLVNITMIKIIGVAIIALGFASYYIIKRKLTKSQRKAVQGVEGELPRFVSYLTTGLRTEDCGVLALLERYTAEDEHFKSEMGQTIADAKTSNFTAAMARWDQRVNSDKLKMVIHGLVSANNGDNVEVYFAMLERDFTAFEIALLKQNVKTIPGRMKLPKMLLYTSIAVTLFYPIIMQIIESFKSMFMYM